ncbi:hypothetical protein D3C80_1576430 [compost metagenome]
MKGAKPYEKIKYRLAAGCRTYGFLHAYQYIDSAAASSGSGKHHRHAYPVSAAGGRGNPAELG